MYTHTYVYIKTEKIFGKDSWDSMKNDRFLSFYDSQSESFVLLVLFPMGKNVCAIMTTAASIFNILPRVHKA